MPFIALKNISTIVEGTVSVIHLPETEISQHSNSTSNRIGHGINITNNKWLKAAVVGIIMGWFMSDLLKTSSETTFDQNVKSSNNKHLTLSIIEEVTNRLDKLLTMREDTKWVAFD